MSQSNITVCQDVLLSDERIKLASSIAASLTEMLRPHIEWLGKDVKLTNSKEDFQRHFTYYIALSGYKLERLAAALERIRHIGQLEIVLGNWIRTVAAPCDLFGFMELGGRLFPPSSLIPLFERTLTSLCEFLDLTAHMHENVSPHGELFLMTQTSFVYEYPSEPIRDYSVKARQIPLTDLEKIGLSELKTTCANAFHSHFFDRAWDWYTFHGCGVGTSEYWEIGCEVKEHKELLERNLENYMHQCCPDELNGGKLERIGAELQKMSAARRLVESSLTNSTRLRTSKSLIQKYSPGEKELVDQLIALEDFLNAAISVEEANALCDNESPKNQFEAYERILRVVTWFLTDIPPLASSLRTGVPWGRSSTAKQST